MSRRTLLDESHAEPISGAPGATGLAGGEGGRVDLPAVDSAGAALVPQTAASDMALMFERLATNPDVNVEKLEHLIQMQERILAHNARAEFEAAFHVMQGELPVITENGEIEVDGVVRSKYARYEDIIEVVRPIISRHGFSLRHRNQTLPDGKLRIVGILSHRAGHTEQDEFDCPPDTSGKKNNIQAIGSTRSYGQRYTTISLLNIVTRGADDDAKKAGERKTHADIEAPAGFEEWVGDLQSAADNGWPVLSKAFNDSKPDFRNHLRKTNVDLWERLKAKAKQVQT
jgi:hypothetical protein